jgi:hypothetical protein
LPGVLVRVYRSPRGAADAPIGVGMTDWRGNARGEALVPVRGVARFRAGAGENVVETEQELDLEVTRDSRFTGTPGELPDVPRIEDGTGVGLVRPDSSELEMLRPAAPLRVRAGREYVVQLAMP